MSVSVYVLKLQNGKYYVGKTIDLASRLRQHFSGNGSAWTQLHPPVKLLRVFENVAASREDEITMQYMAEFGWQNVRGGSYCDVNLSKRSLHSKRRETLGQLDRCLRCGRSGHWVSNCFAKTAIVVCYKCGRAGHTAPQCYAKQRLLD